MGAFMKKILIQLDNDKFASTFDSIVAYDAGADVVQSHGGVTPYDVRNLIMSAFFTRGIPDLKNLAAWIGGSDVDMGEQILAEAQATFFGPFKISIMLDSNGCNTTACTAIAKLARQVTLKGKAALVIGCGPVGLRAAQLMAGEGCRVQLTSIPAQLLGKRFEIDLAQRTLRSGRKAAESFNSNSAGLHMLPSSYWTTRSNLKWLIDFNLTEPLGIEGIKPGDDFAEYDDKRALGALAIGTSKMKVHKACIARLFERNDLFLNTEGVYAIAKQLI